MFCKILVLKLYNDGSQNFSSQKSFYASKNHNILHHLQTMMIADTIHPPFTSQVITVMILVFIIPM